MILLIPSYLHFNLMGGTKIAIFMKKKQKTLTIASDQMKAHFPHTIEKNTDFHCKITQLHFG
jgi:hypothetical protein